jgi:glycosyltransferase involved in cell wall biosynthesis
VLIEAMAMARPILATEVDGIPELVESTANGILVAPEDAIGLARELSTLGSDPRRLRRMGAEGRVRFDRGHHIDAFLAATWRQYGEVADGWPTSLASS